MCGARGIVAIVTRDPKWWASLRYWRAARGKRWFVILAVGLAFPHAAQAIQIVRRKWPPNGKKWFTERSPHRRYPGPSG